MAFFFSPSKQVEPGRVKLNIPLLNERGCKACPLDRIPLKSPKMKPTGTKTPIFYIIGEAPGETEDAEGRQFVGDAGKFLWAAAPDGLVELAQFDNVLQCKPPKNRTPEPIEIECCRNRHIQNIEKMKPKAILAMGGIALEWCIGERGITYWRGRRIPVKIGSHSCWLYPMLHPSYVIRNGGKPNDVKGTEYGHLLWLDLRRAYQEITNGLKPPSPCPNPPEVMMVRGEGMESILSWRKKYFKEGMRLGFDIETNFLRPYYEGAEILSASIATDKTILAIGLKHSKMPEDKKGYRWIDPLLDMTLEASGVVCHNASFEIEWMIEKLGKFLARSIPWQDTMVQSYCLNETLGEISLDELCLEHLGRRIKKEHKLDRNRLDKYPLEQALRYNGHDAWYALQAFNVQERMIKEQNLEVIYKNQMRRIPTFALSQQMGLIVDGNRNKEIISNLEKELSKILASIMELDCIQEFEKAYHKKFNPGSPDDMRPMLRDILKIKKFQGLQRFSTDEATLNKIDHPLTKKVLEYRKAGKLKGTYADSLTPITGKAGFPDGKLHTIFHGTRTRTGRTSSSFPNMQNFPKRKNAWIRSQIIPPEGHCFLSSDFKQMEVVVIAIGSKDRQLVQDILDDRDIHEDWAFAFADIHPQLIGGSFKKWKGDKGEVKRFRNIIKNKFVFPAFYGAGPTSISTSLRCPEQKTRKIWEEFFKLYHGIKKWQETLVKRYSRDGYIECLDGFRRHAPIAYNEIINTPIQGSASQIVVNAMDRLSEKAEAEERPQLQALLNIHDDLTFAIPDESIEQDTDDIIKALLTPEFDWIDIPISVEVSVGENWHKFVEVGVYNSRTYFA